MARACCTVVLLALGLGLARASIPVCPEDSPYAKCTDGNPCDPSPCGEDAWCQRGCGCEHKCFPNDVVTIAGGFKSGPVTDALGDAIKYKGGDASSPGDTSSPGDASSPGDSSTAPKWGPIVLPAKPHLPNMTQLLAVTQASLTSAVRAAVVTAAPALCKGESGKVSGACARTSCDDKPCGSAQACVPVCGSCSEHKCVSIGLPKVPKMPVLPNVTLPKLPLKFTWPKPPCSNNEAMNLVATIRTIPATLLMSQSKRLSLLCSPCRAGTVAKQPAVACQLCLPGTYADARLSLCRACPQGYHTSRAGATECAPCPANTFAPLSGSFACIPCPPGFNTQGRRAQAGCAFDPTHAYLV